MIYFNQKALKEGKETTFNKTLFDWEEHIEESCRICSSPPLQAGRPKRQMRTGRPPTISFQGAIKHINTIAPVPISTYNNLVTGIRADFQCPICLSVFHQPIELTVCQTYVCCCESLSCPCCYSDHIADYHNTTRSAPPIILTALGNIRVSCKLCKRVGFMKDHDRHINSKCTTYFTWPDSCNEILNKPQESPLTPLEAKLQSSLLRRSLSSSVSLATTVQVKTGGQVCTILSYKQIYFKKLYLHFTASHFSTRQHTSCSKWESKCHYNSP